SPSFFACCAATYMPPPSLHDALPICVKRHADGSDMPMSAAQSPAPNVPVFSRYRWVICALLFFATTINYVDRAVLGVLAPTLVRSEEHTSELQSRENLVCRLLLDKKK